MTLTLTLSQREWGLQRFSVFGLISGNEPENGKPVKQKRMAWAILFFCAMKVEILIGL
ncbi:hypothetical protein [Rufibacter sp. LB8]|uniref:hypothetical protein n=1 Tax=Rufibacter sp. LB8 TaxID=2777781 RepID=UPI00178C3FF4|nr:hypothetical protein [Rufibacter sp. LB8]